jgi:hypothetical protein
MRCTSAESPRGSLGNSVGVRHALRVGGLGAGDVLRLHLQRAVGVGRTGVEQLPGEAGFADRVLRPEVGCEEGDRSLEVAGVHEQRPALVAGRNLLPGGPRLRPGERQRQIAVPEPLPAGSLREVQPVRRPQHPRAELRDRVLAVRLGPVAALARAGPVGPFHEVRRHAPHDELRRLGGVFGVAPPAEPAFDVRVALLQRLADRLREHPRAGQPRLKPLAGILLEKRPGGDVHREAGTESLRHLLVGHEQVARHLPPRGLRGRQRRRHDDGDRDEHDGCQGTLHGCLVRGKGICRGG